jgi:hypothetical protein
MSIGRYEWERLVRRIVMPKDDKFLAFTMATWADPDGTRVRPGLKWLMASTGDSERTVRRHLAALLGHWGLLELVSRGGGRGGTGRTAEYRLTIPADLLDRHVLLDPNGDLFSPATQVTGHSDDSPATHDDRSNSSHPVDNLESPATIVAAQSNGHAPIDRPNGAGSHRLTGQKSRLTGHPAWPTTSHSTNHQERPTPTGLPTQPQQRDEPVDNPERSPPGLTLDQLLPLARPPKPPPGPKCTPHGLAAGNGPDGRPRCPFCRRQPQEPR